MLNIIYMTVKISGELYEEPAYVDTRVRITMSILSIDKESNGVI